MQYIRKPNRPKTPPTVPATAVAVFPTAQAPGETAPVASVLFEDRLNYLKPTFSLAVSHCPWREDRAAIMRCMRPTILRDGSLYKEITDRAPNHVWSRTMWSWGASQPVTHGVYLQDDLRVHPQFWNVIEAMVRAVPNRIISLISNHPMSDRSLAEGHAWFRQCETLGSGYIVPTVLMGAFLAWADRLSQAEAASLCEDYTLSRWQYETGRRSWCPIPTIIQTIDDVVTTNPAISYPFRRSYITWEDPRVVAKPLTSPSYWTARILPPDFGPSVGNDSRMARGPFQNDEILATHNRIVKERR